MQSSSSTKGLVGDFRVYIDIACILYVYRDSLITQIKLQNDS